MEKIKAKVTDTKQDIMKIYKAHIEEINAREASNLNPVAVVETKKREESIAVTRALKVESFQDQITNLLSTGQKTLQQIAADILVKKEQFAQVEAAIGAKEDELRELFDISKEANTLAALIQSGDKQRAELQADIESLKDQITELDKEYVKKETDWENQFKTDCSRKLSEWEYNFKRDTQKRTDDLTDTLIRRSKSLDERQANLDKLEAEMKVKIAEHAALLGKIATLESTRDTAIATAVETARKEEQKSAAISKNIIDSKHESALALKDSVIFNLERTAKDLKDQLNRAENYLLNAQAQVQQVAIQALKAQGDAATISQVAQVAAGGNSKK